eukprot:scaffold15259_cov122-Cylindrotheca_fusiformis.AAC.2
MGEGIVYEVVLFYKYHPLSSDRSTTELYRSALECLCRSLELQGRILVGCSEQQSEGINGTLSGASENVRSFVDAMCSYQPQSVESSESKHPAVRTFWQSCLEFYQKAQCEPLVMTPSEFKFSRSKERDLFPDLNIKLVNELIGTGGVMANISLDEVHQGYLTPSEWHERVSKLEQEDDTVLIDCRNTKEFQIGHFPNSLDPNTTTFNQFPTWVQQHSSSLAKKKVLMYCTGGIRCEKASAFIRREVPSVQEVRHLKGGIHKYLDEYGSSSDCLWQGKNFVFDGRGAHKAAETSGSNTATTKESTAGSHKVVGTCSYCPAPYDTFDPKCVCTVCREPTLVCPECKENLMEYHCRNHEHLRLCYFTDLSRFSASELQDQLSKLNMLIGEIAVGRKYKQKRKTLKKQCEKIMEQLAKIGEEGTTAATTMNKLPVCRNCGETGCPGLCWGFHGLKRKRILEERKKLGHNEATPRSMGMDQLKQENVKRSNNSHLQEHKENQRQKFVDELVELRLAQPVSAYQMEGIRAPPPCTRVLQTNTKGKWCGKALLSVLQTEFSELANTERLSEILKRGILRLNDIPVTSLALAESLRLKNMDVIDRIVHWHEPPVLVPADQIDVQKANLPAVVQEEYSLDGEVIYLCAKPSTVPVHPAGPYLSNSLTIMVEAQEGLRPRSLIPCHRIDRATSGLTICCTNVKVARLVQARINEGGVKKQYLAKVHGRFPMSLQEANTRFPHSTDVARYQWRDEPKVVQVDGAIETVDPANGFRRISAKGKPSSSLFQYLSYDAETDTSIISCCPLTGRSHQLRVHLQWLGFPIIKDRQYGGKGGEEPSVPQVVEQVMAIYNRSNASTAPAVLSSDDVRAAEEICPCCKDMASSFTSAQLLQGGHEICLHALRYQIPFLPKARTTSTLETLANLDLEVPLPIWAKDIDHNCLKWLR